MPLSGFFFFWLLVEINIVFKVIPVLSFVFTYVYLIVVVCNITEQLNRWVYMDSWLRECNSSWQWQAWWLGFCLRHKNLEVLFVHILVDQETERAWARLRAESNPQALFPGSSLPLAGPNFWKVLQSLTTASRTKYSNRWVVRDTMSKPEHMCHHNVKEKVTLKQCDKTLL